MAYSGKYHVKNPEKYKGDINNVRWLSTWELCLMKWLDNNSHVIIWASEEIIIPYFDPIKKKIRKYMIDFYIHFDNGKRVLVEVKPTNQTIAPKVPKRKTKKYFVESYRYINNLAKWDAAAKYAMKKDVSFEIWDQKKLRSIGLKII